MDNIVKCEIMAFNLKSQRGKANKSRLSNNHLPYNSTNGMYI